MHSIIIIIVVVANHILMVACSYYLILADVSSTIYQVVTMLNTQSEEIKELKERLKYQEEQQQQKSGWFDEKLQMLECQIEQNASITELQQELAAEKELSSALQEKLEQVEAYSVELQQQLDSEKETTQMLQTKCEHLQNTVISSVIQRVEAVEIAVQAVERLWVVSREEVHLSNNILGTGGWGYVKEATYRGRKVAAKCLHRNIVSPHNQKQSEKET